MNIKIHSREEIEKLLSGDFPKNTAVISFYDPPSKRTPKDCAPIDFSGKCDCVYYVCILNLNFGGSEELVLFAAFWFYFIGSSLAYRDDAHINADMSSLLFKSEKAKQIVCVVKYSVSMVIAVIALIWAFNFVSWSIELWPTTPIYDLPLAISRLSILVSFVLMNVYILLYLIKSIISLKGGK